MIKNLHRICLDSFIDQIRLIQSPEKEVCMKAFYHEYEVYGQGLIPIDMLRYNQSFPSTSEGLSKNERGVVKLGTIAPKKWTPTEGRWRSFGWIVKNHHVRECGWA